METDGRLCLPSGKMMICEAEEFNLLRILWGCRNNGGSFLLSVMLRK
jgi:hypothetical protein